MYRLLSIFICLLFLFFIDKLPAADPVVTSKIKAVRVYQGAAFIQRWGILRSDGKNGHFLINALPKKLKNKSVSLKFTNGNGKIFISRLQISDEIEQEYQNKKITQTKQEYDRLSRHLNLLNEEFEVLQNSKRTFRNLFPVRRKPDARSYNAIVFNPNAWQTYQKMISGLLADNSQKELALIENIDALNEKIIVAEAKLNFLKSYKSKQSKTVRVDYTTKRSGVFVFQLEYIALGAEWYPRYSVTTSKDGKQNELKIFAITRNQTGEDWHGVTLSFSAANYQAGLDLPIIREWRFGERRELVDNRQQSPSPTRLRRRASSFNDTASSRGLTKSQRVYIRPKDDVDEDIAEREEESKSQVPAKPVHQSKNHSYEYYQQARKKKARSYLHSNLARPKSFETEKQITSLNQLLFAQKNMFHKKNYWFSIRIGKQAQQKLNTLSPSLRNELVEAEQYIRILNRRANIARENKKLLSTLVAPRKSSGGFDYRYQSNQKYDIESNEAFHTIKIAKQVIPAKIIYECSPSSKPAVYTTSISKLRKKEPLLEGPLDIYLGKHFIGTSRIKMTSKNEALRFPLGVDRDIEVDRKEDVYQKKQGFFSKSRLIHKTISIRIRNRKPYPVSIKFIEKIPYSNDDNIKIIWQKSNHKIKKQERGLFTSLIRVPAGKNTLWKYSYTIEYPASSFLKRLIRNGEE